MKNMLKPIGAMLVGLAFLLSCIWPSTVVVDATKDKSHESLEKVKEFHTKFTSPCYFISDLGQSKLPFQDETFRFSDDKIIMNGPSQLDGLISINGIKRRVHHTMAFSHQPTIE